jgi:predicted nuclease of predicted toxin-antitoxin system
MKFVADECCDVPVVEGLRSDGHDVVSIREVSAGTDDETVLRVSAEQERILLTEDKDFGELVVRFRLPAYGILLLRMDPADSDAKLARLREVLGDHADRLAGSFTVVDEIKTRFRPLKST